MSVLFRTMSWSFFFSLLLFGCSLRETTSSQKHANSFRLLGTYSLEIPEPSGLSLGNGGASLWTVSDQTAQVYQMSLTGNMIRTLPYVGKDLEGVAFDSLRGCLWVTEEESREIVQLSLEGKVMKRRRILSGTDNSGLEGICVDAQGAIFALKEKNPGLFLQVNQGLSIVRETSIHFAPDFSGICADTSQNVFWIVSDQGKALFEWGPEFGVQKRFVLPFRKAEGIALDFERHRAYIVFDTQQKLLVYSFGEE